MWSTFLALLPLSAALNFPHVPSAQEALDVAGSILHPATTLTHASDMVLSSIPTDDHLVITSALHPVSKILSCPRQRLRSQWVGLQGLIRPELQATDQVA